MRSVTRLEKHRKDRELNKSAGSLLTVEELTSDELVLVNSDFVNRMKNGVDSSLDEMYATYSKVLHEWGVMCPHPLPYRLYDGQMKFDLPRSFDESRWYDCQLCGAAVINR